MTCNAHEQIYYEHWHLGAHATIDATSMAAFNFFREKRCACIQHICLYSLCTCDTPFYVGVGGGDMQSTEHHLTCNMFVKVTYKMIESNYLMPQLLHSEQHRVPDTCTNFTFCWTLAHCHSIIG